MPGSSPIYTQGTQADFGPGINLPNGRYLISVMASGYKEDISPVNSGPDEPAEHGLAGFVGHIADYLGEVTTDVFGNPLCTQYETDVNGNVILTPPDYPPTPSQGPAACASAMRTATW